LNGYKGNVKTIGLPDEYIEHGQRELLLKKFGVCQEAIIELVRSIKQLSKINI